MISAKKTTGEVVPVVQTLAEYSMSRLAEQLLWAVWKSGSQGDDLACRNNLVVFYSDRVSAVFEQFIQIQIFGDFGRLAAFSAVIFADLGKYIGYCPVVVNGKIEGAVRFPAGNVEI